MSVRVSPRFRWHVPTSGHVQGACADASDTVQEMTDGVCLVHRLRCKVLGDRLRQFMLCDVLPRLQPVVALVALERGHPELRKVDHRQRRWLGRRGFHWRRALSRI